MSYQSKAAQIAKGLDLMLNADKREVVYAYRDAIVSDVGDIERELNEARAGTPHNKMVERFLSWKLPDDFCPDCGISFDGCKDDEWNKNKSWPVGTNLFTADQALAMFRHCAPTVTQDSEFHPDWSTLEAAKDSLREHMKIAKAAIERAERAEAIAQGWAEAADRARQPDAFYNGYSEGTMRAMQAMLHTAEAKLTECMAHADALADTYYKADSHIVRDYREWRAEQ